MKVRQLIALAASASLFILAQAHAQTVQFSPSVTYGTYTFDSEPPGDTSTYSVLQNYLYIGHEGEGYGNAYFNNYFIFDLSDIPAGDVITSATLSITEMYPATGSPGMDFNNIDLLSSSLSPSLVLSATTQTDLETVWDGLASGSSLEANATFTTDPANPITTDVTITADSDFLALLNANIGSTLLIGNYGGYGGRFDGGGPSLDVTALPVPEPSSAALMATATAAFIGFASRRRR